MNDFIDNKKFWTTVKPFLTEIGNLSKNINLKEGDEIISQDTNVAEILNTYFSESVNSLHIQENRFIVNSTENIYDTVDKALFKFQSHPSILKIKERVEGNKFRFLNVTRGELMMEINDLNPNKANTLNNIPVKNLQDNIDITGNTLLKIINDDITNSHFPDKLKLAEITPLLKDNDVMNKKKYRPISILPSISKIYERIMQSQISKFIETHLHINMCGYRNGYSTQFALLTLVEKWKKNSR